jgi:hypothetical protein
MVIFHSYVSLPEGTAWFSRDHWYHLVPTIDPENQKCLEQQIRWDFNQLKIGKSPGPKKFTTATYGGFN